MLTNVLVDGIDIHREDKLKLQYVYGDDRPYIKDYCVIVDDILQTVDGNVFLDVTVNRMDGHEFIGISNGLIFNASYIVRNTLEKIS